MPYTVVSFHAHPDDEALLTGGTLARIAAEGHRVILVTATAGEAGLTSHPMAAEGNLLERRMSELRRSAAALGCQRVHLLGYDDSGVDGRAGRDGLAFARTDVEGAAARLATLLQSEGADVITIYDEVGGYGHPDHVQVHRVGMRAAEIARTAVVLEATVDRRVLQRLLRVLRLLGALRRAPAEWQPERLKAAYSDRARLTHRVDVRRYTPAKRAAMAAHSSQRTSDTGNRALDLYLRLPRFVFRRVFGYEWFTELGRTAEERLSGDIFATLSVNGRERSGGTPSWTPRLPERR